MKISVYTIVLASFVAVLLMFATTPSIAAGPVSDSSMDQSGATGNYQGQNSQNNMGYSTPAKSGASQEGPTHTEAAPAKKQEDKGGFLGEMKDRIKGETQGKAEMKPEAQSSGAGHMGVSEQGKTGTMEREKTGVMERGAAERGVPAASKGGDAVVLRVDKPKNCLTVRSEPSASSNEMACLSSGEKVRLTGVFSRDGRWAQLDNNGWVFFSQLQTDVRPPQSTSGSWKEPAAAGGGTGKAGHRSGNGRSCYYGGYYYNPYYYPGYYYTYPSRHYGGWFPGFYY